MASTKVDLTSPEPYITPAEIYSGTSFNIGDNSSPNSPTSAPPITLRIATGGAGQSGLIRALANKFIEFEIDTTDCPRFSIAWLLSDTSASFNYLGSRAADCSITYHKTAEEIALKQGIAERRNYAWRDHWLLVGRLFADYVWLLYLWSRFDDNIQLSFEMVHSALIISRTETESCRSSTWWYSGLYNIWSIQPVIYGLCWKSKY